MCTCTIPNNKKIIEKYKIDLERENIILNDTDRFGNFLSDPTPSAEPGAIRSPLPHTSGPP